MLLVTSSNLQKLCVSLHVLSLHQNHIYILPFPPTSLLQFLRAIWNAISWATEMLSLWAYFSPNEAKHSSHIVLCFCPHPPVDKDQLLKVSQLRLPLNQLNANHDCVQAISAGQPHQPQNYKIIKHCFRTQKILKSKFPAPFPVIQVQQVWI